MMGTDAEASFGEILRELRYRKKLTRGAVAQLLGMSPSSIEKWERGNVLPDRRRVEEMIHALELSASESRILREAHAGLRVLPSLHNLPTNRNQYFTGRAEVLEQLHQQLASGRQIALNQAISGLGGIGKTQVALEYAYRYQKDYSHLLWVTADSRETLTTEFSKLARDLDLPEKDEKDQSKVVQSVQRWLRDYIDWLLIFDNIEDLGLVVEFVPTTHLGAVLLITRLQVTEPVAQTITLNALSSDDGALFLLRRTKRLALGESFANISTSEVTAARAIVHQLGGLPLALDQAGSYILETAYSLTQFLELFQQRQVDLLMRRGSSFDGHPAPVTTTFSMLFEQVQAKSKAAIDLLKFCSYLAPDAIPLEIIAKGGVYLGIALKAVAVDDLQLDQVLEVLQAYSLVSRNEMDRTLSIHRLVQAVLQNELEEAEKREWAQRAVLALNAAFPNVEHGTWPQCERLLSHALLAAHYIETEQIISEQAGRLLQATALYLKDRGRFVKAEPLYEYALHIREQQLGPDHPDVASSLNDLANLYFEQGKYAEAEPLYLRALSIREQQLGPDHPDVASSLNGLANLYFEQGKYVQAELFSLRALRIREQRLGPDHPDVASSLNGLANLYFEQGKYAEAESFSLRALHIWEQHLEPEHLRVAYPLNNLANIYSEQGKYAEAESFSLRALHIWEQHLEPEHPRVAYPLNNLADIYSEQGKYAEAESLYLRALHIWEQQLGPEHPYVASSLNGLANLYFEQGKYAKAEPLYLRALHIREQQLGPDHPDVASSLNDLANLYFEQGKYAEAEPLYLRALSIRELHLGPDHPDVASSLNGLANLYFEQGKYAEAEPLYLGALYTIESGLGPDHPDVASSLNGLANLYFEQGKYAEAEPLYLRALRIKMWKMGKEMLLQPVNNLFMIFADQSDGAIDVAELPLLLLAVQSLEFLIPRPDLVRKITEESLKHYTRWGHEQLVTNKDAHHKNAPRLFQERISPELLVHLTRASQKNRQIIANTLCEKLLAPFNSVEESEVLIALEIALELLGSTDKNTQEFTLINDLALDYFQEGHHEAIRQLIIDIIEARFINHSHIVVLPTIPLSGTKAQVSLFNGSVMIRGKEDKLILRITNSMHRSIGEINIELTRSAEYDFLAPPMQFIPSLSPHNSIDVCFPLRMKVAKQVSINYLVNGEMRDPPLSIYASRDNPYIYGSPVDEGDFFGRQDELLTIVQAVTKPVKQDILVVGERRSGKTSLLYQIIKRLDAPFIPVYIILNTCRPSTDDILDHILHNIIHKLMERHILDSTWQRHDFVFSDFASKLEEVLQAARRVVQDLRLVLLLDEADFLLEIREEHLSPTSHNIARRSRHQVDDRAQRVLRAALQSLETGNCLRAVVAGTNDLSAYMLQHSSPFFNHFRFVHLKPLTAEETYGLIVKPAEILGIAFSLNAIERISSLSGCQPYYCQALCYETFASAQQWNNTYISNTEVDAAEQKICADLFHAFISGIWRRAKPKERAFLIKLARRETAPSNIDHYLQRLLDWQIVSKTQEGYRFSAGLFERWTTMAVQVR